jgi:NDP-sugar pyrophosphorylase family protein
MTVLVERVITEGALVNAFPIVEYWCDIGLPDDYELAKNRWHDRD